MKNHIIVLSRTSFYELIKQYSTEMLNSGAFICIHDPEMKNILNDNTNVLNLWFHDADHDTISTNNCPIVLFDENMALEIKNFVFRNLSAKFFLIHCTAGKCRSGAVGEVLADYFRIPYFEFKKDNPQIQPNVFIKNSLKKIIL